MFQVKSVDSRTYTFCAASVNEKKTWLDAFHKAFADMQPADKAKRQELQDAGIIPLEQRAREGSADERKSYALQMIIQAASENQQQQGHDQKSKRYGMPRARGLRRNATVAMVLMGLFLDVAQRQVRGRRCLR